MSSPAPPLDSGGPPPANARHSDARLRHGEEPPGGEGIPAEKIAAIPVGQAVAIHLVDHYNLTATTCRDALPYWQGYPPMLLAEKTAPRPMPRDSARRIAHARVPQARASLIDGGTSANPEGAITRRHQGLLPPSLAAMTATLILLNPGTGKEFNY